MPQREDTAKVEKRIRDVVEEIKRYNPKRIILFGSRAKGHHKKTSDIDIAVEADLTFREKRRLKERVDEVSGIYSVDLVFLSDVDEEFKRIIQKEGKVLYEKD